MKTLLFTAILIFSAAKGQKKDFTKQQILKHPTVIQFAETKKLTRNEVYDMLKCQKKLADLKYFRSLPIFTGKLPIITNDKTTEHNKELWDGISSECLERTIHQQH